MAYISGEEAVEQIRARAKRMGLADAPVNLAAATALREILGTPLVTSLFHSDRWEYVFTLKRPGEDIQTRKLTAFFKGDVLERSEGDEMPSETEFVATLGARDGAKGKVPTLEATPEQLAKYPPSAKPAQASAAAATAPAPTSYPPLDAPAR